ncbi:MAG: M48 family metalloprotease [Desulfobacterales bacterium]
MAIERKQQSINSTVKSAVLGLVILMAIPAFLSGCKTMESLTNVGTSFGKSMGLLTDSQAESITKTSKAVERSFEDFTPQQEYYIGRAVGAVIVNKYKPYNNKRANAYINLLGQTLAQASDMPDTFNGYHFLILDSNDINALSAPGGLIFITRGLLRCCQNEDAVAAVLAHEIGHVEHKNGLQAIKKSRVTSALITIGTESAKTFGNKDLANLTKTFEGSISDITSTMINSGYSRNFERQADLAAVTILKRVGYDPNGLVEMLKVMETKLKPGGLDFAKTHPSPESRIADIQKHIGKYVKVQEPSVREKRFLAALRKI